MLDYSKSCDFLRDNMKLPVSVGFQKIVCLAAEKIQELELKLSVIKTEQSEVKSQGEKKPCQKKTVKKKSTKKIKKD